MGIEWFHLFLDGEPKSNDTCDEKKYVLYVRIGKTLWSNIPYM